MKRILVIGGSDPSGGAGIQADIRAVLSQGGYPCSVITALTVQDSSRVHRVVPVDALLVREQIEAILEDISVDAIKLGMLASREIVQEIIKILRNYPHIPVIADPVLRATSGCSLLDSDAWNLYCSDLLPHTTLVTPNIPELFSFIGYPESMLFSGRDRVATSGTWTGFIAVWGALCND